MRREKQELAHDRTVLVFDTETTGLSTASDRVVQLGAAYWRGAAQLRQRQWGNKFGRRKEGGGDGRRPCRGAVGPRSLGADLRVTPSV